jgi:hypothetical protein
MSWSSLKKHRKYIIVVIAIAIVVISVLIIPTLLPPGEVTVTGTVLIMREHDPINQRPAPVYIKFTDLNTSAVYEYEFSTYRIVYLGSQAEYSQKVPNGQTYRIEIGWSAFNSSGSWIAGNYTFDQPAGEPVIAIDFSG